MFVFGDDQSLVAQDKNHLCKPLTLYVEGLTEREGIKLGADDHVGSHVLQTHVCPRRSTTTYRMKDRL